MADRSVNLSKRSRRPDPVLELDALELRDRLATGALRASDFVQALIEQVELREGDVQAWAWLEEAHVIGQANRLDSLRKSGLPIGPLHGMPVALQDIVDTQGIPTENGTAIDKGRVPMADAVIVRKLKAAGAIIMGKTVTTEMAFLAPGKTRNPVKQAHTAGGASQGSAAAVGAAMVPLAVGVQTEGSVNQSAAYCGVVGFKPSFGAIPRSGVLAQSPSLDTVGVFAVSVEGVAVLADALFGDDPADLATAPAAPPRLLSTARSEVPVRPTFAIVQQVPGGSPISVDTRHAMEEMSAFLGEYAFPLVLPPVFDEAAEIRELINVAEMAKCYYGYERRASPVLSEVLQAAIDKGKRVLARDYIAALDWPRLLNAALDEVFDRCDAIICPAAPGPAPERLVSTGDESYSGLWTLCGVPVVTLPLFEASNGLPMGLQLVGRRGNDARLLRTARWLMKEVGSAGGENPDA